MARGSDDLDVEAKIDALYRAPLDRFTAERNALADTLKKTGDKAEAARVKALAKPSVTAWAVNQVWWQYRDRFRAMLDAGAAQRKAHVAWSQGRKGDVREAGDARRRAVEAVANAALEALAGDRSVAPDVKYRIAGTVEALASGGVPEGETPGRLTRDFQSSGLEALSALAEAAAAVPRPTIVARGTPGSSAATAVGARPRAALAGPAAVAAREAGETARERKAREAAEHAARARDQEWERAESRAAALAATLEAATRAFDTAAKAETEARVGLEAATARRVELEEQVDEARATEAAAKRLLSRVSNAASRAELDRARAERDATRARAEAARLDRARDR